jgi:serine/threonine protein kinase
MDAVPPVLRMGKYVLDGLLGPGGVTETYLAHAEAEEKPGVSVEPCALKLLRADRVPDGAFARVAGRFLSAARQLRDFHRPGFCRVVDLSEDPSATFMVADFIPGCDLGRLLETCLAEGRAGVHPVLVGLVGSEIARLLHVGHTAKPVFAHLGLCPQNVMVTASGEVALLDAGIAASLRGITEQPPERWALVAPEHQDVDLGGTALADRAAVAADLYSLGALLFLLLFGRPPSLGMAEIPEVPGMTGKLAAALRTLLARPPDDRPESAAVLVDWLAGDVVQVRERQRLIAKGVRTIEKGPRITSQNLPTLADPAIPPTRMLTLPAQPARLRWPLRTWILLALACALGGLAAAEWLPLGEHSDVQPARAARLADASPVKHATGSMPDTGGVGSSDNVQPANPLLVHMAGHLIAETVPPGAAVWVDGVLLGTTFADLTVGEGAHRVALIAPGHRVFRQLIDTSRGAVVRRALVEVPPPGPTDGFVDVVCRTDGKFPVMLDGQETGRLCPTKMLPASSGKHTVGIFVPKEWRVLSLETTVEAGSKPARVTFND